MDNITTHEAKTHLSALLKRVEQGEEIQIRRGAIPVAKLVPIKQTSKPARPKVGTVTSPRIDYKDDAFAALSDEEMRKWGFV